MSLVSILLPSLRCGLAIRRLNELKSFEESLDYEVIVVSPFPVSDSKVIWVQERESRGTIYAHNLAYKHSTGKYIIAWSDDLSATSNCMTTIVNFVEAHKPPFVAAFSLQSEQGTPLSGLSFIYGKPYATFSCMSRKTIEIIGGYYNPIYRAHWADPDLGLRVWEKGGSAEVCKDALAISVNIEDDVFRRSLSFFQQDFQTFLNTWHSKLGRDITREEVERNWHIINHS